MDNRRPTRTLSAGATATAWRHLLAGLVALLLLVLLPLGSASAINREELLRLKEQGVADETLLTLLEGSEPLNLTLEDINRLEKLGVSESTLKWLLENGHVNKEELEKAGEALMAFFDWLSSQQGGGVATAQPVTPPPPAARLPTLLVFRKGQFEVLAADATVLDSFPAPFAVDPMQSTFLLVDHLTSRVFAFHDQQIWNVDLGGRTATRLARLPPFKGCPEFAGASNPLTMHAPDDWGVSMDGKSLCVEVADYSANMMNVAVRYKVDLTHGWTKGALTYGFNPSSKVREVDPRKHCLTDPSRTQPWILPSYAQPVSISGWLVTVDGTRLQVDKSAVRGPTDGPKLSSLSPTERFAIIETTQDGGDDVISVQVDFLDIQRKRWVPGVQQVYYPAEQSIQWIPGSDSVLVGDNLIVLGDMPVVRALEGTAVVLPEANVTAKSRQDALLALATDDCVAISETVNYPFKSQPSVLDKRKEYRSSHYYIEPSPIGEIKTLTFKSREELIKHCTSNTDKWKFGPGEGLIEFFTGKDNSPGMMIGDHASYVYDIALIGDRWLWTRSWTDGGPPPTPDDLRAYSAVMGEWKISFLQQNGLGIQFYTATAALTGKGSTITLHHGAPGQGKGRQTVTLLKGDALVWPDHLDLGTEAKPRICRALTTRPPLTLEGSATGCAYFIESDKRIYFWHDDYLPGARVLEQWDRTGPAPKVPTLDP